jgi:1-acyl-sn-glycerol-3-phosphate acyltransferase
VVAAGYLSNASTFEMVEGTAAALREGQSVIIFPEGTRTTPGQAMQFHRGAANIAVKGAGLVTPVFVRCDPTTLAKNMPWYRIPPRRVRFTLRVGADIDVETFRSAPPPLASRAFNERLLQVFEAELRAGGRSPPGQAS